ncbi:hypothetical protein [Tenacibaculum finnmarkense]|uniref:hypothetical protein n=1 Tax=Tenacibaculum finnmarkense TaxID=2781243 RepID=UPI00187BA6F7|nr:hypothetical protein [Tenacibaculum finnmarkense]MBE7693619.1 hypothetical protein [Tenacibaculum finnmarkense genomovar finnmarkense]
MKKGTILLLFAAYISFGMTENLKVTEAQSTIVYVCGKSKIYHKVNYHSALKNRCKSGISEITESKAKSLGKRVCRCRY